MLFRLHTWRPNMTRQQLDESFTKYYDSLVRFASRRVGEDGEDIVSEVYIKAVEGVEYERVRDKYIRSWWLFKVKARAAHKRKMDKRGMEAEQQFYSMLGETVEQEMTEGQAQALIEAHWKTLPRYTKTRIRQDWEKNNLPLLQFMRPQTV
jgi:DNA-directed RNA polymerase specialized sigma24 family protein